MEDGTCDNGKVICPWHGAEFDLKSGAALCEPATENVGSFEVKVHGKDILVKV